MSESNYSEGHRAARMVIDKALRDAGLGGLDRGSLADCQVDIAAAGRLVASLREEVEHLKARLSALAQHVQSASLERPAGHSGDEESGQHDEECGLCAYEALYAHADDDLAYLSPTPPAAAPDCPLAHVKCSECLTHVPADMKQHQCPAPVSAATVEEES